MRFTKQVLKTIFLLAVAQNELQSVTALPSERALEDKGKSQLRGVVEEAKRELQLDPKSVTYKPVVHDTYKADNFDNDSVIAIINTPKCGTGGMYSHFSESYNCRFHQTQMSAVFVAPCEKPRGIDIIKSHDHENSLHFLRDRYLPHRPEKKCLIVTAVRDPKDWLPSKFMEDRKKKYCEAPANQITPKMAVEEYRAWLTESANLNRHRAQWNIPHFLRMYGTTLTEQMKVLQENGGYSLHPPISQTTMGDARGLEADPPLIETRCSLLFLHFEQADRWPEIFKKVSPGVDYRAPEGRDELCPDNVARYHAIKDYQLTQDEKIEFIGHDDYSPYLEEWFRVYGFLTTKGKSSFFYKSQPDMSQVTKFNENAIIAVVNTPKCGTGGMYRHFSSSYDCKFKNTLFDGVMEGPCQSPTSVDVIKSHHHENSMLYLKIRMYNALKENKKKKEEELKKCLIVTAVRDPKTWFPSKFMEDEKTKYCEATDITPEDAVSDFKDWLIHSSNRNRHRAQWNIPHFMDMYGTSLTEQMKVMKENKGYSLLAPVPPTGKSLKNYGAIQDVPVQSYCHLLLLQVEYSKTWPDVFKMVAPGPEYQAPEDRDELCPANTERNTAIKAYELTDREKKYFIGNDEYSAYLEEWFKVYGYYA